MRVLVQYFAASSRSVNHVTIAKCRYWNVSAERRLNEISQEDEVYLFIWRAPSGPRYVVFI